VPVSSRPPIAARPYEELKAKGGEFVSEPKDQFYGVEAVFKDPFGNRFSMSQPKNYGYRLRGPA